MTSFLKFHLLSSYWALGIARRAIFLAGFFLAMTYSTKAAETNITGGVLTIKFNASNETVTLSNNGTNISLSSSVGISGAGTTFATASVTSIIINDAVNLIRQSLIIANGTPFSLSGGLNISGVEKVTIENSVTATGSSSISVVAPQNIIISGAMLTGGTGGVQMRGLGTGIEKSSGVELNAGAVVTATGTGNVFVEGKGGNSTEAANSGVFLTGANTKITSSGGNVEVNGSGGSWGSSSENHGTFIVDGAEISAGGMGRVKVSGQGGNKSFIGYLNSGVVVAGLNSKITSSGGNVEVKGTGGSSLRIRDNHGVHVLNSAEISAGNMGSVSVEGNGGIGEGDEKGIEGDAVFEAIP